MPRGDNSGATMLVKGAKIGGKIQLPDLCPEKAKKK